MPVVQLGAGPDDRLAHPLGADGAVTGVQGPNDAEGEAVDSGVEAAELLAQQSGQHGQHALDQVHRGGPDCRLLVQSRAVGHKVRDIRNVDANFHQPVSQRPDAQGVVEVPGSGRVDGEDAPLPQVPPLLHLLRCDVPLSLGQARQHLGGEFVAVGVGDALLEEDGRRLSLDEPRVAQHIMHLACRKGVLRLPLRDARLHQQRRVGLAAR
mmetsp:Transcript_10776/g.30290  ORF Transcript_10776/g.30290 Transcript_10776/m.30290 type:complete len:210 (-) Transcript_10776:658-1287(-)